MSWKLCKIKTMKAYPVPKVIVIVCCISRVLGYCYKYSVNFINYNAELLFIVLLFYLYPGWR